MRALSVLDKYRANVLGPCRARAITLFTVCPWRVTYGFRADLSCTSQLIHLFHTWASALDKGKTSDVVFLDFEKAFDSVYMFIFI